MATVVVYRLNRNFALKISNAEQEALRFFTTYSKMKPYDDKAGKINPDTIDSKDLQSINSKSFLGARSAAGAWSDVMTKRLPWLEQLDPTWNIATASDITWQNAVLPNLTSAFSFLVKPHRQLSRSSKMLYWKRPYLAPILDSIVMGELFPSRIPSTQDILNHIREQLVLNLPALTKTQAYLSKHGYQRSEVRILDSLLWSSRM